MIYVALYIDDIHHCLHTRLRLLTVPQRVQHKLEIREMGPGKATSWMVLLLPVLVAVFVAYNNQHHIAPYISSLQLPDLLARHLPQAPSQVLGGGAASLCIMQQQQQQQADKQRASEK